MNNNKTIHNMPKKDVKKMCEELKTIGVNYKVTDSEKSTLNSIMFCLQMTWNEIHGNENIIQM